MGNSATSGTGSVSALTLPSSFGPSHAWVSVAYLGLQGKVREDLLDHRLFQNDRDDLQLAATVRAVLQVEVDHAVE